MHAVAVRLGLSAVAAVIFSSPFLLECAGPVGQHQVMPRVDRKSSRDLFGLILVAMITSQ